jgi:hypothetical protein
MPNLIGTGNNQIPTNGMLGGLAYQSPDNAVIRNLELTNLSGHNSVIPSNAVDVFVYDTRKDSDGGQWRKRTQHTSWYNETLNTATRGSRRDFPAVAVIVATTSTLTIYDGDDPDLPMWMVINQNIRFGDAAAHYATGYFEGVRAIRSVSALNATLCFACGATGSTGAYSWLMSYSFIDDRIRRYNGGGGTGFGRHCGDFIYDISRRHESSNIIYGGFIYNATYKTVGSDAVASATNDVDMIVLPNSLISNTTNLPIPTIVVATDAGVSIIPDTGNIVNWLTNVGYIQKISISKNYELFAGGGDTVNYYSWYIRTIPTASTNSTDGIFGISWSNTQIPRLGSSGNSVVGRINTFANDSIALFEANGATTGIDKLILINENANSFGNSLVSYITSSYNTGWMHGDIKGAWLNDTSTTSLTGTELVTNGTFAGNLNGWTLAGEITPTYDSASGGAKISTANSVDGQVSQTITSTTGVVVTFSITARTSGFVGLSLNGTLVLDGLTALQSYTYYSDSTITSVGLAHRGGGGGYAIVDNVSIRKTEKDRSVNNRGLAVYGTITKTPVATGSNLVGYSGWSNSNYLLRPTGVTDLNNSSMTFMSWYKGGSYGGEEVIISTGDYNTVSEVRAIYLTGSGVPGFSGWANDYNPGNNIRDNNWHFICVVIQYVSGTTYNISVYVDGIMTGTTSRSLLTFSNTAIDVGGGSVPGTRYVNGSISLVRLSTTVPSPEQIRKIYEDEKALFQSNSQCTLYGSSDAVTALAYDDTYQILSVGTSSGRSDFRGLERINNTTTAVTTAISASNGLIAEQ